jgi:hypothetical protein
MYQAYAYGNQVELWNNQRTLDYLRGNPYGIDAAAVLGGYAAGVAGNLGPYAVNKIPCSPASAMFCDQPNGVVLTEIEVAQTEDLTDSGDFGGIPLLPGSSLNPASLNLLFDTFAAPPASGFMGAGVLMPTVPPVLGAVLIGCNITGITVDATGWTALDSDVYLWSLDDLTNPLPGSTALTGAGSAGWNFFPAGTAAQVLSQPAGAVDVEFRWDTPIVGTAFPAVSFTCSDAGGGIAPVSIQATGWTWIWAVEVPNGLYELDLTLGGDNPPWYDPDVPDSADFYGLFVEDITGFDSVVQRDLTAASIYGGSLGPLKLGPRTLTVTGYLFAKTCCGSEYGLHWLNEALIGSTGCDDCALGDFFMLKCCPPEGADPIDYGRLLHRTGLVDGPKVVDKFGTCCDQCGYTTLKVQFTVASELPYIFSDLTFPVFEEPFGATEYERCFFDCTDCPPVLPVTFDPDCGVDRIPPPLPFIPDDDCFCEPWVTKQICASYTNVADWNSATSFIQIFAGATDLRNLKISAYENPRAELGVPCPCGIVADDPIWQCIEPCQELTVSQLPSGSTLTVDSRTRIVSLQLAGGGYVSGQGIVGSAGFAGFQWFDLPQCAQLCFIISVDARVSDSAWVTIGAAGKFLASGG